MWSVWALVANSRVFLVIRCYRNESAGMPLDGERDRHTPPEEVKGFREKGIDPRGMEYLATTPSRLFLQRSRRLFKSTWMSLRATRARKP